MERIPMDSQGGGGVKRQSRKSGFAAQIVAAV